MDIVSIIILALIGLGLIIGIIRGFPTKKLSFWIFMGSLGLGYIGGVPLARYLMDIPLIYDNLQHAYLQLIPSQAPFSDALSSEEATRIEQIKAGLTELKIPGFLQGVFSGKVLDISGAVGEAIASSFTYLTVIAVCFLLIVILVNLLCHLILKLVGKAILGEKGKSFFGRIFGCLLGGSKAIFLILLIMIITSLVNELMVKFGYTVLQDWLNQQLFLDQADTFSIGKFFYQTSSSLLYWINHH